MNSMQAMQHMLWRGLSDRSFLTTLLDAPRETMEQYSLGSAEIDSLTSGPIDSLVGLASRVEAWRRGDLVPVEQPALALAS
jgi:hypothetical protein